MIDGQRKRDPAQPAEEQSRRAQPQWVGLEGRGRSGERPYLHLHEAEDEGEGHHSIGDLLRAERLRRGEDLDDVATRLRLRPEQLRAIEDGAYEALPGTTYATGFVRSYASYLGLDAQEAVERFKRETQGAPAPAALAFPEPSREARVPRGWMVLLAIGIVGVLYAGWYYGSVEHANLGASRPAEPEAGVLAAGMPAAGEGAQTEEAVSEATSGTTSEVTAAETPPAADQAAAPPADGSAHAGSADGTGESSALAAAPASASGPAAPGAPAAQMAPGAENVQSVRNGAGDDPWASSWLDQEAARSAAPPSAASAAGPDAAASGQAAPALLLRAHGETWVQVEGGDGDILLSRILRAGDEYEVPDRPGLSLTTGNAGALEIVVAGRSAGMVGGLGKVRRDIALDEMRPH